MSNLQIPNLILRDDDFPLLTETIITQQGIEKNTATIPFTKLIQLNVALDALQPVPPNNHTVLFEDTIQVQNVGATQNLEINNNQINILGTGTNPTAITIQGDFTPPNVSNLVITDNTQYYNAMTKNINSIGEITTGILNTTTKDGIILANIPSLQSVILNNGNGYGKPYVQFEDLSTSSRGEMRDDYLQFTNLSTSAELKIGNDVGATNNNIINTNNSDLFVNSQTKQFFKFNDAGYSYKPILAVQNQIIQKYMNYIVFDDGINNVDLNTYTRLLDSDATLPDEERVGWSCKFANLNGVDVTISNSDGISFFSHYGGLSSSPYQLKKFSVVEVTLIWSQNLGQYFYAVSQFN